MIALPRRFRQKASGRRATLLGVMLTIMIGLVAATSPVRDSGTTQSVAQAAVPAQRDILPELLSKIDLPEPEANTDGQYEQFVDGYKLVYTIDKELQDKALKVFKRYKVPYGAFVAVEPTTGKILALVEYSKEDDIGGFCFKASYPAASLVKIMTAAAALETGEVEPDSEFRFEGSPYKLYKRKISKKNKRWENNVTTLSDALGKSNNVVFGKIGVELLGREKLLTVLDSFGFNKDIPFDFPLEQSTCEVPEDRFQLARTAAGFGDIRLSPIHAALIGAAVGNEGVMMRPYLVDRVEDQLGMTVQSNFPTPVLKATSPEIAGEVSRMMKSTVTRGTSAKVFARYGRNLRQKVGVAGKTGSLTGSSPPGRYEWFVGFAPVDSPEIAVASLVVNQGDLWHIKGTYVAQQVLSEFFDL